MAVHHAEELGLAAVEDPRRVECSVEQIAEQVRRETGRPSGHLRMGLSCLRLFTHGIERFGQVLDKLGHRPVKSVAVGHGIVIHSEPGELWYVSVKQALEPRKTSAKA